MSDDAETPSYIETLRGRGYRFIAPVEWIDSAESQDCERVGVHGENEEAAAFLRSSATGATDPGPSRNHSKWLWLFAAGCILAGVGYAAWAFEGIHQRVSEVLNSALGGSIRPRHISSIAVLPLENLSSDPQQEYFADGLTDTLITNLGQVGTMRVISRASVIQYKRGKTPLPQIAHDLNVDAVVEGTVLRAGSRVRISVQLLDARADRHLWSQTYERDLGDIINLERQAALAIAHEISGRLTGAQEMRIKSSKFVNPEAYDAYLRGTYLLAERSPQAETEARGYFEQALRADPNFAPAYGGLALYYSVACGVAPDFVLAEQYATKAIALDSDLADGHTALAYVRLTQHRYVEAESEFKQAIALNPNYALAYDLYADYWLFMGRPTEALAENNKALQLDPFSYAYNYLQSGILYFLGQYDAALEKARTVSDLNPQVAGIHEWTAQVDWAAGRVPDALAEQRKIASAMNSSQMERDSQEVAAVYSSTGLRGALVREVSLRIRRRTQALRSGAKPPDLYGAGSIAILYSFLADRENTIHWLNETFREDPGHSPEEIMCSRSFDFLRSDPRFKAFERNLALPPQAEVRP